jgi:hypothetical protein
MRAYPYKYPQNIFVLKVVLEKCLAKFINNFNIVNLFTKYTVDNFKKRQQTTPVKEKMVFRRALLRGPFSDRFLFHFRYPQKWIEQRCQRETFDSLGC